MINLTKGNTETIYFTGTEKAVTSAPDFLFQFTHRITGEVVSVTLENTSTTERYDKATLVVNDHFADATEGMWAYVIRENDVNGVIVESGYMDLNPAVPFAPTEYSGQSNDFITYNGE